MTTDPSPFYQKLYGLNGRALPRGLERMKRLDRLLGTPSRAFSSVHIAGTNGKGSVAAKIAEGLRLSGLSVGLYTSPHLFAFNERIVVDGRPIPEEKLIPLVEKIGELEPCTFFETATLAAFLYFAHCNVDIAVLETGLGGRYDATNIVLPKLAVISSISRDHCAILGETLEEIALEKAGIIKKGRPVIIGPQAPVKLLAAEAEKRLAPATVISGSFASYDEENSAIAAEAMTVLGLKEAHIREAVKVRPRCRHERFMVGSLPLIFDVAHNPAGIAALLRSLTAAGDKPPFQLICGFSKDKEIARCLQLLEKVSERIYLVAPRAGERSATTAALKEAAPWEKALAYPSIDSAMKEAISRGKKLGQPLLICGSFAIMEEAWASARAMSSARIS